MTCEIRDDGSALTLQLHALSMNPFDCIESDSSCIYSDAGLVHTFILHPS